MGGSFNPVHIGHLIIADFIRQHAGLDEVWLTLSPLNPLKESPSELIDDRERLKMLEIACENTKAIKACAIELSLPRPSYTASTLAVLSKSHQDTTFSLIIGSDNWLIFDKWKNHEEILRDFNIIVYPRQGYTVQGRTPDNVSIIDAPTIELSSTFIRQQIRKGYDMNLFLPGGVGNYIMSKKLYQNR